MRIGIIGTGNVGSAVGTRWALAGHDVMFGARDAKSPQGQALVAAAGKSARAGTVGAAARLRRRRPGPARPGAPARAARDALDLARVPGRPRPEHRVPPDAAQLTPLRRED